MLLPFPKQEYSKNLYDPLQEVTLATGVRMVKTALALGPGADKAQQ